MPLILADPPARASPTLAREQAWALKKACYAAWSSQPQQAVQAAQELRRLSDAHRRAAPELHAEIAALADWTEGIAHLTQGRLEAGCRALDRAQIGFAALGQDLHAAETQVPKIMGLTLLGRHDDAASCGEAAEREFMLLGDLLAAAKVGLNLGSMKLSRDANDEAALHYRNAAVRFARVGDHQHSVMCDIGLADALAALGQIGEAARMLARARMRAAAHELPVLEAMADESAALLALVGGRYHDALAGFERARRAFEKLQMPQQMAVAEKELADAYLELRLLPEALSLYEQAVGRFADLQMPTEQAWALAQQGRALALSRRIVQGEAALLRAGQLFKQQQVPSGLATVALARAELTLASPLPDAAASLQLAESAFADFEVAGLIEGQVRAEALRARALLELGRLSEARGAFGKVKAHAEALQLLGLQAVALTGQGQVAEAEGHQRPARWAYEQALVLTEAQRSTLPGDEIRSAFLADHLRPYQGLLRLALADAADNSPESAALVLQRLDRFRARALADRLQQGVQTGTDPGADTLRTQLNWLYRREQRQRAEGEVSPALSARIRDTERELLERSRRERLAAGGPAPGVDGAWAPADLQARLAPGDALLAYGVEGDELFACVVTPDRVHLQRHLASWQATQQALRSLRFQLDTLRVGTPALAAHLPLLTQRAQVRLQQVHALLWAPLVPLLQHSRRVLVVPHGALAGVPFAALHDGDVPLVSRHELALAPSVQVALHGLRRAARPAERVRAFGHSEQLPHVASEALRVAARFVGGQAFVGPAATLRALGEEAPAADLLHLACHAEFRGDNPMFSALHLADGALTAEAIEQLPLAPCTVVLSACDTALSGPDAGDDRVGLVRAFLVAGAARVLASLWPVDDELTEVFMQRLHAALAAGQAPAAALRAAQLALMSEQPHPCHWAAFSLHGGW